MFPKEAPKGFTKRDFYFLTLIMIVIFATFMQMSKENVSHIRDVLEAMTYLIVIVTLIGGLWYLVNKV